MTPDATREEIEYYDEILGWPRDEPPAKKTRSQKCKHKHSTDGVSCDDCFSVLQYIPSVRPQFEIQG